MKRNNDKLMNIPGTANRRLFIDVFFGAKRRARLVRADSETAILPYVCGPL